MITTTTTFQTSNKPTACQISRLPARTSLLQRKCACGGTPGLTGQCEECSKKRRLGLQTKLTINEPEDQYEKEADRVSEQVMRMETRDIARTAPPAIQRLGTGFELELATKQFGCPCAGCEGESEAKVDAVSGGQPLTNDQRAFFEPRFGVDFSRVRIHDNASGDAAARAVGAFAYTRGSDIVFRQHQYRPDTTAGRHLLAHELTHVVQQGAAPDTQHGSADQSGEKHIRSSQVHIGGARHVVQLWPGDGMLPPGDCDLTTYVALRGAVAATKALVSSMGACAPGDTCLFLATKIAAVSAEIAARLALMVRCFRGGDTDHRTQLQDKVNMLNRCYRFFTGSNCPQQLVEAMAAVVERALEVIAAAALAVIAALVIVELIEAIIALVGVIVALAAEIAAVLAAAAAVIALLVLIKDELSPGGSSSA